MSHLKIVTNNCHKPVENQNLSAQFGYDPARTEENNNVTSK